MPYAMAWDGKVNEGGAIVPCMYCMSCMHVLPRPTSNKNLLSLCWMEKTMRCQLSCHCLWPCVLAAGLQSFIHQPKLGNDKKATDRKREKEESKEA